MFVKKECNEKIILIGVRLIRLFIFIIQKFDSY